MQCYKSDLMLFCLTTYQSMVVMEMTANQKEKENSLLSHFRFCKYMVHGPDMDHHSRGHCFITSAWLWGINVSLTTGPGIPLRPSEPGLPGDPWGPTGPVFPWGPSRPDSPWSTETRAWAIHTHLYFLFYLKISHLFYLGSFLSLSALGSCWSKRALLKKNKKKNRYQTWIKVKLISISDSD